MVRSRSACAYSFLLSCGIGTLWCRLSVRRTRKEALSEEETNANPFVDRRVDSSQAEDRSNVVSLSIFCLNIRFWNCSIILTNCSNVCESVFVATCKFATISHWMTREWNGQRQIDHLSVWERIVATSWVVGSTFCKVPLADMYANTCRSAFSYSKPLLSASAASESLASNVLF